MNTLISKNAKIGKNVIVGLNTVIEDDVEIGDNVIIGNNSYIRNGARIEKNVKIGNFCIVAAEPNIHNFNSESKSYIFLKAKTEIKDYSILCRGFEKNSVTIIMESCQIAYGVYIAHNCYIGKNVVIAPHACLGGKVKVGDYTNIGTNSFIHQGINIGEVCMIGAESKVVRDVPHYALVDGIPALIKKVNIVGMKRRGLSKDEIIKVQEIYEKLYMKYIFEKNSLQGANYQKYDLAKWNKIITFIDNSSKGCTWLDAKGD